MLKKSLLKSTLALLLLSVILIQMAVPGFAATGSGSGPLMPVEDPFTEKLHQMYDEPEEDYWPWVRWWLNEAHHTDPTLQEEVQKVYDQGFAGAEFLGMPDNDGAYNSLRAYYGWGSAEWINDTKILMEKATELGMGVAMTSGANWNCANLPGTFQYDGQDMNLNNKAALKQLNIAFDVTGSTPTFVDDGEVYNKAIPKPAVPAALVAYSPEFELQGVYAYKLASTTVYSTNAGQFSYDGVTNTSRLKVLELEPIDLMNDVPGAVDLDTETIEWENETGGPVQIIAIWLHGTGQRAEPSVTVNWAINYLDPYGVDAFIEYWDENVLTPEMKELIAENGNVEIYMDSLELSCFNRSNQEMLWGLEMREGFEDKYGYDPIPWIPFVRGNHRSAGYTSLYEGVTAADKEITAKVRNDIYDYLTLMYTENTLKPLSEWLHANGMKLRAEISYNQPFEFSIPAEYVDFVETETLDFETQVDRFRAMAGGAHVFDKIFSVEMGALNNSTFKLNIDQYNQNIYACFASGIQKNVLHGYSSIVGSNRLRWPGNDGMLTSYNERFSERQPSSIHYKDWTTMIARYQKMLQQGTSKMDLAILRTDYQPDSIHRKYELLLTPPQFERGEYFPDSTMQQLGYTYDYFAPALLEKTDYIEFRDGLINPDTMGYQAVILYQDHIALSSAQKLLEFAQQGLPVVFVNGVQEILQWPTDTEFVVKDFGEACSKSLFTSDSDADVQAVIDQIKALPTTRTIDSSAGGIENDAHLALQELGVYPRAAFHEKSHNLVTAMRETDDEIYLFAYNHRWDQSSAYEAEITLDALGKPYNYNAYTGVVESIPYTVADGKTVFTLAIEPGDATMVVFDKTAANNLHVVSTTADKAYIINGSVIPVASVSGDYTVTLSDGAVITNSITAPDNIPLTSWDLEVQKWTADPDGLKEYTTEDRPAGWASDIIGADMSQILFSSDTSPQYSTTEYWWPTLKTTIDVGTITDLDPWKDIAAVGPDVSGIGVYETSFTLPGDWGDDNGAYLSIGSISGNTADVYVNGEKVQTVNPRDCAVDITDWLVSGENTVKIEVTSILQNALIELYRAGGMYASAAGANRPYPGWQANVPSNQPRDFGMTGDVELVTYTIANFSHTIDVAGGTGSGVYNPGDEVTITATAPAGKRFSAWTLTADTFTLTPTQLRANPLTFVMPDEDITLTAVFTDIPGYAPGAVSPVSGGGAVTRYTITISAGTNGAITPASASVADGSNQTFAIKAHEGYVVADVLVDGVSVGAVTSYTFTNVKAAHTISATFKEDDSGAVNPPQQPTPTPTSPPPGEVFTDVPKDQWYYDAVYYVYDRGIFKGTAETLFSPDMELTRAMFVTVMGRLAESIGDTATGFSNPFSDVPADQYYTDYVAWAAAHDIVLGYDETTFGPDDYVTREQMAAIFVRFADYMGIELGDDIEKTFPDADSISGWAKESVERAVAAGLMQGDTNGMFQPLGTAIRSEVAQLFKNFVEKYLEDGFEIPQPETIDEVVNEVVDESADESADEVVEEVTDEVTDETVDESADETVDESADETVDESADGSAE